MKKIVRNFLVTVFAVMVVLFFYFLLIKKTVARIYCQRKITVLSLNYKLSINFTYNSQEEKYVDSITESIYKKCLKSEGLR